MALCDKMMNFLQFLFLILYTEVSFVSFIEFAQTCMVIIQPVPLWLVESSLKEAMQTAKYPLTVPNNIRFQLFTADMTAEPTCQ
jgi:hypothetical protein